MKFVIALQSLTLGFVLSLLLIPTARAATPRQSSLTYSQRHMLWNSTIRGPQTVPFMPVNAIELHWSPDGKRLAFINTTSDALEMVDASGRHRQIISARNCRAADPAWSNDSRHLVFSCKQTTDAKSALLDFKPQNNHLNIIVGWSSTATYRSPSWSPAANKLAFEAFTQNTAQLMSIDLEQHAIYALTDFSDITTSRNISWSPDGRKILYNDSANELYTIWPDGSHRSTISDGDSYEGSWSPDGTRIVFIEDPTSKTLSVSEPDGSLRYIVLATAPAGRVSSPRWSPDGSSIGFVIQGIKGGLFTSTISGTDYARLATGPIDDFGWQPKKL